MGTYTTNYNLFMPTVGEQGWGELVNGNFSTIDTTMKGLNTRMGTAESNITSLTSRMGTAETTVASNKSRIGTLETKMTTVEGKVANVELVVQNGNVTAEHLNGNLYIVGNLSTTNTYDTPMAMVTLASNTLNVNGITSNTFTVPNFVFVQTPHKIFPGIYVNSFDTSPLPTQVTCSVSGANTSGGGGGMYSYTIKDSKGTVLQSNTFNCGSGTSIVLKLGQTVTVSNTSSQSSARRVTISSPAMNYYLQ